MPQTEEYSQRVHNAFELTQGKDGMTNANVKSLQKLLAYYPENSDLEIDGSYGKNTIAAVKSFYKNDYWTDDRKLQSLKDMHGEEYIMKSEMEQMLDWKKKNPDYKSDVDPRFAKDNLLDEN